MFVFRIEDNNGCGPYSSPNDEAYNIFGFHNTPECMEVIIPNESYYFSWGTIKSLKENINPKGKKLLHNNEAWKLSVYDVSQRDCIICLTDK